MEKTVEYNQIAIYDVIQILQNLLEHEKNPISVSTANLGETSEKITEIAEMYNTIDDKIHGMIQQVTSMVQNVVEAVEEVDDS